MWMKRCIISDDRPVTFTSSVAYGKYVLLRHWVINRGRRILWDPEIEIPESKGFFLLNVDLVLTLKVAQAACENSGFE